MGCDIHEMVERKQEYGWINSGCPDIGRDYELYAVLAGVRNSYKLKPIAEPKGLPKDMCYEFSNHYESWKEGAHSMSWVTLAELKAYDLSQEFYDSRLVTSKDESGRITSTCATTTGKHLGEVGKRTVFSLWGKSNFEYIISYMENVKSFHKLESDNDVRLVFFFDN